MRDKSRARSNSSKLRGRRIGFEDVMSQARQNVRSKGENINGLAIECSKTRFKIRLRRLE